MTGTIAGTVLDRLMPRMSSKVSPRRCSSQSSSAAYSSGMRVVSVSRRQLAVCMRPSKTPSLTLVLPTSIARTNFGTVSSYESGPLMSRRSALLDEPLVQARVGRQLWMERRRQEVVLSRGNDTTVGQGCQCFNSRTDALDQRRAYEHGMDRVIETNKPQRRLEAVDLPAKGVALHRQVHQADASVGLRAEDVAG